MKGTVFIALNDMIESQYGMQVWEELLEEVKPICGGVYVATEEYPDEEVVRFVLSISKKLSLESSVVTRVFGHYLFGELNRKYTGFTNKPQTLYDFLDSIENVIHVEVRKLFPNACLPTIDCNIINTNEMIMTYHSERKLCFLAEGLIIGASEHYNEPMKIKHTDCMHDGHDACLIHVIRDMDK